MKYLAFGNGQSIEIGSYGEYASVNYGVNTLRLYIKGKITLWYSYDTIVAFRYNKLFDKVQMSPNEWSTTTGKHLNWIKRQVGVFHQYEYYETFEHELKRALESAFK